MKNTIDACVEFDFKGQHHVLCVSLDLDQMMTQAGSLPVMYPLIARHNQIDSYSYEYEMMQAEAVLARNATGWVSDFIHDEQLDVAGFEQHWRETQALAALADIAQRHMNVTSLDEQPALKAALLAAYRLGVEAGPRE